MWKGGASVTVSGEAQPLPPPVDPRWVIRRGRGHYHCLELWFITADGHRCDVDPDGDWGGDSVIGCVDLATAERWMAYQMTGAT